MLTKLFSSNSIFSLVILILLAIVLWAKAFVSITPMLPEIPASPVYHLIYSHLSDYSVICGFVSLGLIILEALLINNLLVENDLIPRNSYLAAYVFVIMTGVFSDLIILNPILIANFFLITAVWLFLKLYEEHESYATVFNIGTLLSIASMVYLPSFAFIILIWAGFIIYRLFSWREWFISIIGFALPYLFLGSYYFWNDCLVSKIASYKNALGLINFFDYSPALYTKFVIGVIGLIVFISTIGILRLINEKAIRIRKFLSFFVWFLLLSIVCLNLSVNFGLMGFVLLFTPAAFLITLYVNFTKKPAWAEGMLIVLALLLITGRLGLWNIFS
jgi:hypothetical protein